MSYQVGKRVKVKGKPGLYIYAGKGMTNGRQPLCYYFTYRKSGYIKVGWNHEGFTLSDAENKRQQYILNLREGINPDDDNKKQITFNQGWDQFMNYANETHMPRVMSFRSANKVYFKRAFGSKAVRMITKTDIERFMGKLPAHLSQNYQVSILTRLRTFFNHMVDEGVCLANPCRGIKKYRRNNNTKERYLELHEIEALKELCDHYISTASTMEDRLAWTETRAQILLMVEMGLRRSEVRDFQRDAKERNVNYSLLWERINWETRMVLIVGKGNKTRVVKMTSQVEEALRTLGVQKRGPVFTATRFLQIKRLIQELNMNHGLDKTNPDDRRHWVSCHTFRHTFGTYAALKTMDLRLVAKLMGHSVATTTETYSHLIKGEEAAAMDKLSEFYLTQPGAKVIPLTSRRS